MSLIVNKDKTWNVKLDLEGSERQYKLFDSMEYGLALRALFLEALLNLQEKYEHYESSDCIRALTTPAGEDFSEYAVFMILFQMPREDLEHIYLFTIRKDNNIQLLASNDDELTIEKFSEDINKIILEPNEVKSLLIAYVPFKK